MAATPLAVGPRAAWIDRPDAGLWLVIMAYLSGIVQHRPLVTCWCTGQDCCSRAARRRRAALMICRGGLTFMVEVPVLRGDIAREHDLQVLYAGLDTVRPDLRRRSGLVAG
jgi:hypothetical protein